MKFIRLFAALRRSRFRIRNYWTIIDAGRQSSLEDRLTYHCGAKQKRKRSLFDLRPGALFGSLQPSCFLLATLSIVPVRAFTCIRKTSYPEGTENLLISSVDAALAGQNTLLAAGKFGLWYGVIIDWFDMCQQNSRFLSHRITPVFGIAQTPNQTMQSNRGLPYEAVAFEEEYRGTGSFHYSSL